MIVVAVAAAARGSRARVSGRWPATTRYFGSLDTRWPLLLLNFAFKFIPIFFIFFFPPLFVRADSRFVRRRDGMINQNVSPIPIRKDDGAFNEMRVSSMPSNGDDCYIFSFISISIRGKRENEARRWAERARARASERERRG